MAPELTHFLAGATLVLLAAAPLAFRGYLRRRHLWLVVLGGLWGMFPDIHYVTPVFQSELAALHDSRWADLFAFHYTLDQPPFDTRELLSIAASIVTFVIAVAVFTAATAVGDHDSRRRLPRYGLLAQPLVLGYAAGIMGLFGGIAVGAALVLTGRLELVAELVGRESTAAGWLVLFGGCTVVSAGFAMGISLLNRRWHVLRPGPSLLLGVCYGLGVWLVAVVLALPLWMRIVLGLPRPIPYLHVFSLVVLVGFGLLIGLAYPPVWRFIVLPLVGNRS
ncbi:hypothetical protein C482_13765 [Natrialba chahannaoensis JCM 10990]|uniref:Uncharacterized protein n=1 Tax=Natrialba chahannaoensis JCM 10990 TaxID=1227492 RepID=M0AEX1_9EURY|nr:hypothetical protein [Natrialba chahannaoensis]ELY97305.1 hypothetical protein C482_13765 [Natrialba chahannaoensis JCM 10990]